MTELAKEILLLIRKNPPLSSKEIHEGLNTAVGYATVKRGLTKLTLDNLVITDGKGKATKYLISPVYELLNVIDYSGIF